MRTKLIIAGLTILLSFSVNAQETKTETLTKELTPDQKSIQQKEAASAKALEAEKTAKIAEKEKAKAEKLAQNKIKEEEKRIKDSEKAAARMEDAQKNLEKQRAKMEKDRQKSAEAHKRYTDAKEKLADIEEDIVNTTEKFEKQNKKGNLSPNDIQKWNNKLDKLKGKSAAQHKKMEKAEKEFRQLSK